jgi:hypothetical protein
MASGGGCQCILLFAIAAARLAWSEQTIRIRLAFPSKREITAWRLMGENNGTAGILEDRG